ncbi:carboxy terminal-processing peptidase [Gilvimarinus sp. SDUM040013]|uniref:Carboxy terminal-processing peptidase n=1 Tax=Gilvimarinus gilvus TaxID=3058038 RepID=A0ABU4RTB2_9GAMM|nr:carboxy terminal-processing peptidase [Gilvimarinus sp. SDUM040013]MDO3386977.1 carboxy terminal-processing peptidase [Gilvimarinus sp. SDUM040013]MDX6848129.1 carboxy terminal-processing peptidase [Gilvimarinus sp. SDUM040013]
MQDKMPLRRVFHKGAISAIFLAASLLSSGYSWALTPEKLEITAEQEKTTAEIVRSLHEYHYRDQTLNDELSERFLQNYLKNLDPGKSYLLKSDVDRFMKHKSKFDDDFKEGELTTAVEIYSTFLQRFIARSETTIALLEDEQYQFDFEAEESLLVDRDQANWPADAAAADELWRKRIKADMLNLKLAGKEITEAREVLVKRYSNQMRRISQQTGEDAFNSVINAFTMLYDPHTNYFSPRTLENFNINMSLSLEGIGAMLQSEDEYTKVVRLIPAGPADKQGQLKPADRIVAVGQDAAGEMVDVIGWRLDEVVDLIRGKKDSIVRLEILPAKAAAGSSTHTIKIKRDKVKLEEQAAQSEVFELSDESGKSYKVGVIDIPTFYMDFEAYRKRDPNYRSTTRDVFKLLSDLAAKDVDGVVIDLRNNGGGSLHEATSLTDLFIDQGPVVQIRQTNQLISRNYRSHSKAMYRGPIVVLINRLSASASEIFAGAIQDYGRGIIVGSQSFGKGSVQSLQPLKYGQLKVTESKFYRVSGDSTQHRGVLPDIELPTLIDPELVGESSYEYALPWDSIHAVKHDRYFDINSALPQIIQDHGKRTKTDPDFVFLTEELKVVDKMANRDRISLREKTRLAEKVEFEEQLLALENTRRKAKGLELYKTYEDISGPATDDEVDPEQQALDAGPDKIDPEKDPFLKEAGYILLDFIKASGSQDSPKVANF